GLTPTKRKDWPWSPPQNGAKKEKQKPWPGFVLSTPILPRRMCSLFWNRWDNTPEGKPTLAVVWRTINFLFRTFLLHRNNNFFVLLKILITLPAVITKKPILK